MNVLRSVERGLELGVGMAHAALHDPNAWERSIRKYEAGDRTSPPAHGGIVFTGSSSFTLWSTLERDMAPLEVINRGFGGAVIGDCVRYMDRIVVPYRPRGVVLFAGTNDIAGRRPASPEHVADQFGRFAVRVWEALPEALIFYVAITPSRARWPLWPIAAEANEMIHEQALDDPRLRFIDFNDLLLGPDGLPERSLYRADKLHPSKRGYILWASEIKSALEAEPSLGTVGRAATRS